MGNGRESPYDRFDYKRSPTGRPDFFAYKYDLVWRKTLRRPRPRSGRKKLKLLTLAGVNY